MTCYLSKGGVPLSLHKLSSPLLIFSRYDSDSVVSSWGPSGVSWLDFPFCTLVFLELIIAYFHFLWFFWNLHLASHVLQGLKISQYDFSPIWCSPGSISPPTGITSMEALVHWLQSGHNALWACCPLHSGNPISLSPHWSFVFWSL